MCILLVFLPGLNSTLGALRGFPLCSTVFLSPLQGFWFRLRGCGAIYETFASNLGWASRFQVYPARCLWLLAARSAAPSDRPVRPPERRFLRNNKSTDFLRKGRINKVDGNSPQGSESDKSENYDTLILKDPIGVWLHLHPSGGPGPEKN